MQSKGSGMKSRLSGITDAHLAPQQVAVPVSDSVCFVIHHHLHEEAQAAYEMWLGESMRVVAAFPGYRGVKIVRSTEGSTTCTSILDFATHDDATRWHHSTQRAQLIRDVQPLLDVAAQVTVGVGIEYWLQPERSAAGASPMKPPAWKQWLITTLVIWPLTMLVPWAFDPLFKAVPALGVYGLSQGILAAVIVALAVWVIMPHCRRLTHDRLFSDSKRPLSGSE